MRETRIFKMIILKINSYSTRGQYSSCLASPTQSEVVGVMESHNGQSFQDVWLWYMSTNFVTSNADLKFIGTNVADWWVEQAGRVNEEIDDVCILFICRASLRFMVLAASHTTTVPNAPSAFKQRLIFILLYFWICPLSIHILELKESGGHKRSQRGSLPVRELLTKSKRMPLCGELQPHMNVNWTCQAKEHSVWLCKWIDTLMWICCWCVWQLKGSGASCLCAVCMFSMCLSRWAPSGCSGVTVLSKKHTCEMKSFIHSLA